MKKSKDFTLKNLNKHIKNNFSKKNFTSINNELNEFKKSLPVFNIDELIKNSSYNNNNGDNGINTNNYIENKNDEIEQFIKSKIDFIYSLPIIPDKQTKIIIALTDYKYMESPALLNKGNIIRYILKKDANSTLKKPMIIFKVTLKNDKWLITCGINNYVITIYHENIYLFQKLTKEEQLIIYTNNKNNK